MARKLIGQHTHTCTHFGRHRQTFAGEGVAKDMRLKKMEGERGGERGRGACASQFHLALG